jgi:hypothetical protein
MLAPWVKEELATAKLADKRLNEFFGRLITMFAERPQASIPAACGGNAEMTAAYRFCDNEKVSFEKLLAPHRDATLQRIAAQTRVVLAQDTTELDLTRPDSIVEGVGPLSEESRVGTLLHMMHAFATNGTPLGTVHAETWTREFSTVAREEKTPEYRAAKKRAQRQKPISDKESYRWIECLNAAQEVARQTPGTQIVCVADSEADIFELFESGQAPTQGPHADWIVRGGQERALQKPGPDAEPAELAAWEANHHVVTRVASTPVLYTAQLHVRGRRQRIAGETRTRRQSRDSRDIQVEVRATTVTLRPPDRPGHKLPKVTLNVVLVREANPPPDEAAVEWALLTSLPIATSEQVREVVACYCLRWMIEVFFRTLKSGCRIEERRFEKLPRLVNCLALYMIVAWRTLYVCHLGRSCPDASCEMVFEPAEWKAVYRVIRGEMPPRQPPQLKEMVRMVAQLGGYVNKPNADDPGPQTVWLGLARTHDFALCWNLFGPDSAKPG